MMSSPAAVQMRYVRFLKNESGMSGSAARRSASTNATAAATPATASPTITGESHAYVPPPHDITRMRHVAATTIAAAPARSSERTGCFPWSRCGRNTAAAASAANPSGTLIQKHQRHVSPSVNQPPRSGPSTALTPNAAPMMPRYLPRSRGGKMSATIACDRIICPPPPKPWMARPAIRPHMEPASPHTTDPVTKNTRHAQNRCLRPNRSPSLP